MRPIVLLALCLTACAPTLEDFQAPGTQPDKKTHDFAACKITARQTAAGTGGLMYVSLYNEALSDCMTAKGYASN